VVGSGPRIEFKHIVSRDLSLTLLMLPREKKDAHHLLGKKKKKRWEEALTLRFLLHSAHKAHPTSS
jgi:hypothetical protein